jgi:hypothetical protein
MNSTPAAPVNVPLQPVQHASATRSEASTPPAPARATRKLSGYGLPCAKCRTYYPADADTCPVCKSLERVAVTTVKVPVPDALNAASPDSALLEQEREHFLREFKVQMATLQTSGNPAAFSRCSKKENHQGGFATASVCQDCYARLEERVDVLEAALYINLKEATQIVFDAVWADPSDPQKTYENAANALLCELRRRSGVPQSLVLLHSRITD